MVTQAITIKCDGTYKAPGHSPPQTCSSKETFELADVSNIEAARQRLAKVGWTTELQDVKKLPVRKDYCPSCSALRIGCEGLPIIEWATRYGWKGGLFEKNVRSLVDVYYTNYLDTEQHLEDEENVTQENFMRLLYTYIRQHLESQSEKG